MSGEGRAGTRRRPLAAMAEVLRAPLLLSPVADVLGGASLALAARGETTRQSMADIPLPELAVAAAVGIALLAAGMAQNALVDLEQDRSDKPHRPLPAGEISESSVRGVHAAATAVGLLAAGLLSLPALAVAIAIVALTMAYHHGLKRRRLIGCATLGILRALDMGLGIAAVAAAAPAPSAPMPSAIPWMIPLLYGAYIAGASLHASTDDQPDSPAARAQSRAGIAFAAATLVALGAAGLVGADRTLRHGWLELDSAHAAAFLALIALARLLRAARNRPSPVVTGVALSGLYLFQAAVAVHFGAWITAAAVILVLFLGSRLLLRRFPPS